MAFVIIFEDFIRQNSCNGTVVNRLLSIRALFPSWLADVNLPEVPGCHFGVRIIAFPSACRNPMILMSNEGSVVIHTKISCFRPVSPFTDVMPIVVPPSITLCSQPRRVPLHTGKRVTRARQDVVLTAEVLYHGLTFVI